MKQETQIQEGGWQDQYASAIGGFNVMEFEKDKHTIYPLRLKYSFLCELNEHFILYKVNGKKGDIHKKVREYSEKNDSEMQRTANMKRLAYDIRDCLLNQNIKRIPDILHDNWMLKRNKFTTNKKVDDIYKLAMKNGAEAGKLCGSGSCGHMLLFVKPENRNKLIASLDKKNIVDFNFSVNGVETW